MGMACGMSITRPVPVERIRSEGERLGYEHAALEDFETIVVGIDDRYVEVAVKREAADAKAAAQSARTKQR